MGLMSWLGDKLSGLNPNQQDNKQVVNYFSVGGYSRNNVSGGEKWSYGLGSSGSGFMKNHSALRQNARDAYNESMQAKAFVDRMADTVADTGLVLEPTPDTNVLKITPEQAEAWASDVESRFNLWAKSKMCHRSQTMNFYQAQRLYQIMQHRDGEVFTRLFYSQRKELLNPLQFEFLDPNQIRGDAYTSSLYQSTIGDGIIRDSDGVEIGYKIWYLEPNTNQYKSIDIPAYGPKSGKVMMLHGFAPEYPGQGRGYSRLSHAIQEFENITDFSASAIKKAINQSNLVGYVKPSPDNPASNPMESILARKSAGPVAQFGNTPVPAESAVNVTAESLNPVTCFELPEARAEIPGSTMVFNLAEGEDLKFLENKTAGESYDSFVNAFVSHLSASMSMPVEVVLMKFNANYSASRASLILFWRIAQIWRNEQTSDFNDPIYEAWLSEEIAAGRITAPGFSDPRLRQAWLNCNWIGSPMPNIDPSSTAKAEELYLKMGATTQNKIARNYNGSSAKHNLATNKKMFAETPLINFEQQQQNNFGGK